jgi:hypothetical protein
MSFVRSYFHNLYYPKYTLQCLEKIYGPLGPYIKDKPLRKVIDFYQKYRILTDLKWSFSLFYLYWIRNVYSVSVFTVLLPLNTIIRLSHLIIFQLHIFYWLYKLILYIYSRGSAGLRPNDNDPIFGLWYLVFIYCFTWKRIHLHSYNVIYNLLKKLTTGQLKQNAVRLIIKPSLYNSLTHTSYTNVCSAASCTRLVFLIYTLWEMKLHNRLTVSTCKQSNRRKYSSRVRTTNL